MDHNFRKYLSEDDSISYENDKAEDKSVARTVISESCKTVTEKLNKKFPSVPFFPPKDIVLENSSDNVLENDDEDDEFVTNNDNDVFDQSTANDDSSDIIETNLSAEEKKVLKYVFVTIGLLENNFANFITFEEYMLDDEVKNIYLKYHNGDELCYEKNINYLFRNARGSIEKKLQTFFPINTLDVINTQDKVALVLYVYADAFMIKDGTCNIKEKNKYNFE